MYLASVYSIVYHQPLMYGKYMKLATASNHSSSSCLICNIVTQDYKHQILKKWWFIQKKVIYNLYIKCLNLTDYLLLKLSDIFKYLCSFLLDISAYLKKVGVKWILLQILFVFHYVFILIRWSFIVLCKSSTNSNSLIS